ncbi:MAG: hypothetical protein HC893_13260 [Chloroflexaceae bacterium]|nr:hypothetical protein [Chloroflexaceae bacterium]NJL34642.1 hypothetical protein [Chloroflexaceae bacterium]NJO05543.1 hypothetical protein [Chloroflexaceae bacterium]
MTLTNRMLVGAIASNPGRYDGPGEYRYSLSERSIYFSSSAKPDTRDKGEWVPVPSLNPDGSKRMEHAFRNFIRRRWRPSRQKELEEFARKRGWELAMELKYGGGALEDSEADEWQYVVNRELERLADNFRLQIERIENAS